MSTPTLDLAQPAHSKAAIGDGFALGILIMVVINFGQRFVGIVRNIGFCQFLSDAELGQWALANSFFVLAAPLIVLGLPGSFGKFVEHFRQRLCLSAYLRRVAIVCAVSTLVLAVSMLLAAESFAWMIYGSSAAIEIIAWTAITLLAQVTYNFLFDITLSLRQVKVLSWMQFSHGMSFAVVGIIGLNFTNGWAVLLPSYAISCLIGAFVGGWCVWQRCGNEFQDSTRLTHQDMWPRILPFAVSLWLSNLLAGSFELCDRYMLLHFWPGGELVGQAMVGQYYCGRIIPNLLTSVALTLSGILLPYLSADWEAGRYHDIQKRMGYVLSLFSLAFTAISVAALLLSPILFDVIFKGKYEAAQSILGLSLLQCIWASLSMIAGAYLLCAERAKAASINLLVGLVVNIGLNVPLIQYYGLTGSVVATLIANAILLLLTFWTMSRAGCRTDARTLLFAFFPAILLLGINVAACGLAILVAIAGRTSWILDSQDRKDIDAMVLPMLRKARIPLESLWP
jgi:polysaccharide transporter, PST family